MVPAEFMEKSDSSAEGAGLRHSQRSGRGAQNSACGGERTVAETVRMSLGCWDRDSQLIPDLHGWNS